MMKLWSGLLLLASLCRFSDARSRLVKATFSGDEARRSCKSNVLCAIAPDLLANTVPAQDFVTAFKYFTGRKYPDNLEHFVEARVEGKGKQLRYLFGLRHAWVALGALAGDQVEKMRGKLARIHQEFGRDAKKAAKEVRTLSRDPKGELAGLLRQAAGCRVPVDLAAARKGIGALSIQRGRVRPANAPLGPASRIVLSRPDGTLDETSSPRMPMMGLGTGFSDCLNGHMVDVTEESYEADDGVEHIVASKTEDCDLPPVSLYENALSSGTRLIDTAYIYGTEGDIGAAVVKSKLPRSEVFLITKPMTDAYKRVLHVKQAVSRVGDQLKKLRMDHVDVLLWHHDEMERPDDWQMMEKALDGGLARVLGTSGSERENLDKWRADGKVRYHPSVEEHEISPCMVGSLDDLVRPENVTVMSTSSVWFCIGEPMIRSLAKRKKTSMAQLALRWVLDQGVPVLSQTTNPKHVRQNAAVFDLKLEESEAALLSGLSWLYTSQPLADDQEVSSVVPDTLKLAALVEQEEDDGDDDDSSLAFLRDHRSRRGGARDHASAGQTRRSLRAQTTSCPDLTRAAAADAELSWLLSTRDSADGYAVEPAAAA